MNVANKHFKYYRAYIMLKDELRELEIRMKFIIGDDPIDKAIKNDRAREIRLVKAKICGLTKPIYRLRYSKIIKERRKKQRAAKIAA
jgi:hypothetical protein